MDLSIIQKAGEPQKLWAIDGEARVCLGEIISTEGGGEFREMTSDGRFAEPGTYRRHAATVYHIRVAKDGVHQADVTIRVPSASPWVKVADL